MSFFPLDDIRCGPIRSRKHPQDVIGTANTPWGYRVKERTKCSLVKLPPSFEHYDEEKRREIEQLEKILDFVEHTNRRIKKKKIKQRVQQGLAEYEDTVNTRREKLREILLKEEMGLIHEVIYQAQHGDDARMDEIRRRTEEIRKEQEEQRLALVAAKRMQQYLLQCVEVREKLSKKSTIEAKQSNLAQMADNEAKRQAEKELEGMWHQLMLKEVEAKKEREVEEAKRRILVQESDMSILANQVAGKLALEEQKKQVTQEDAEHLKRLLEEFHQEELRKFEIERENREKLKKELQEQILIAKRKLAEESRHEAEMDRMREMIAAEELAKEQASIKESSAALRKELLAFIEYLEELRKEEAKREVEMDRIIEESLKCVSYRRDQAVRKFKQAREKIMRDVLEGREEQMKLKGEREEEEQRQRRLEKEMLEAEIESEAKLAAHAKEERKNKMLRYRKELEDQWKWTEDKRRQELETDKKMYLEELKRQEEYQKLTDELLNASENITPHPFKILLRECAARYAAEKEGRCYCPPPLVED
ncbi:trichohyalin-like [Ceratina calcarata]|uniref:Trichohyalin-like n=1 Tax=Ceratina calcarata TaxID=156304 RepID=A0AAJ7ISW0_9HYME|nr:trichohyalin-like [Ceratina calcarata]